jgi:hypothetical protein
MTAAAERIHAVPAPRPDELLADGVLFAGRVLLDGQSAALAGRIDAAFLAEAGWDAQTWVLTLPAEHPLLGRTFCRAPGCQTTCAAATRVCLDCQPGWPRPGWAWRTSRCCPRRKASAGSAPGTGHAGFPGARARG